MINNNVTKLSDIPEQELRSVFLQYTQKSEDCDYGCLFLSDNEMLDTDTVVDILSSKNPLDTFYDTLDECYREIGFAKLDNLESLILNNLRFNYPNLSLSDQDHDQLREILDNIPIEYPVNEFLNQKFTTNIYLKEKDYGNLDMFNENFHISKNSSLSFLLEQQGYTTEDFSAYLKSNEKHPFFDSVYEEIQGLSDGSGQLCALTTLSLSELMKLNDLKRTDNGLKDTKIILSKDASVGLVDNAFGESSYLSIKCNKDIVIPLNKVESIMPDGYYKMNDVRSIFGFRNNENWQSKCKLEIKDKEITVDNYQDVLKTYLQFEHSNEIKFIERFYKNPVNNSIDIYYDYYNPGRPSQTNLESRYKKISLPISRKENLTDKKLIKLFVDNGIDYNNANNIVVFNQNGKITTKQQSLDNSFKEITGYQQNDISISKKNLKEANEKILDQMPNAEKCKLQNLFKMNNCTNEKSLFKFLNTLALTSLPIKTFERQEDITKNKKRTTIENERGV